MGKRYVTGTSSAAAWLANLSAKSTKRSNEMATRKRTTRKPKAEPVDNTDAAEALATEEAGVEEVAAEEVAPEAAADTPTPRKRRARAPKEESNDTVLKLHLTIQGKPFVLTFDEAQALHTLLTNALPA